MNVYDLLRGTSETHYLVKVVTADNKLLVEGRIDKALEVLEAYGRFVDWTKYEARYEIELRCGAVNPNALMHIILCKKEEE